MKNEKQKTKWYKVLNADLHSFNGGEFDYTPYIGTGVSLPVVADTSLCRRGYHFTTDPMQWPAVGMRVFEVIVAKGDGPAEWQDDKGVFRSGRLGDERPDIIPEWWRELEAFVRSIKEAKIKPQAAASAAASAATRAAAWSAAWDAPRAATSAAAWAAARAAARDAAWSAASAAARAATRAATRAAARAATRYAARAAAWAAARDAAWSAAWDATLDAALDAAELLAICIVTRDLIDPVHYEFARKNWESYLEKES